VKKIYSFSQTPVLRIAVCWIMTSCDYTPESHHFYIYYSVNLKSHCLFFPVTPAVYSFPVVQCCITQEVDKISLNKLSVLTDKFLFVHSFIYCTSILLHVQHWTHPTIYYKVSKTVTIIK